MKKESARLYDFSQSVLYTILKWAVNLYMKYVDDFAAFTDTYTKEWGEDLQKAIAEAQAMPNVGQRRGNTKTAGNALNTSSKKAVLIWKKLRRFIIKAFAPVDLEAALKQAGSEHYDKAARLNFGEISSLMTAAQTFVQQNTDILTKAGMPVSFADDFTAAKDDFDEQHTNFGDAKGNASIGTSDKIKANNRLYLQVLDMFGDARIIFAGQKNIAVQFSFEAIRRIVTKDAPSGIHFLVKDGANKKPLSAASIITSNSPDVYTVNKRGALQLKLPKGQYSYTITNPGYVPVSGTVTLDSSGMHREEVVLTKIGSVAEAS